MIKPSSPFIMQKLPKFVDFFSKCKHVLEIGSGMGEFLHLCGIEGIEAIGVEPDVSRANKLIVEGFDVLPIQAKKFLKVTRAKFDGIFASNVIEHMEVRDAKEFLKLAYKVLNKGGKLALTTGDPRCLGVISETFWNDQEHTRPYSQVMLSRLIQEAGFTIVECRVDEDTRPKAFWRTCVRLFRTLLVGPYFGPSEFYVMAVKP